MSDIAEVLIPNVCWKNRVIHAAVNLENPAKSTKPVFEQYASDEEEEYEQEDGKIAFRKIKKVRLVEGTGTKHKIVNLAVTVNRPGMTDASNLQRIKFTLGMMEDQIGSAFDASVMRIKCDFLSVIQTQRMLSESKEDLTKEQLDDFMKLADPFGFDVLESHRRIDKYSNGMVGLRNEAVEMIIKYIVDIEQYTNCNLGSTQPILFNGKNWKKMDLEEKREVADHFASAFLGPIATVIASGASIEAKKKSVTLQD